MLKALWLAIKIGMLVALCVWVADRPGFVRIEWLDYVFTIHLGFFLLMGLAVILAALVLYRLLRAVIDIPKHYRRYREEKNREKGYRALTIGLSAVAAGDAKVAVAQARRARRLLAGDEGLPVLLEAQAARLDGREADAQESFLTLLEHKDAGFLGVRGLLQAAMDAENRTQALEIARAALDIYPKQKWILRTVYDLETRMRLWPKALETLKRARRAGALSEAQAERDYVAIMVDQAQSYMLAERSGEAVKSLQKALKTDPGFVPAAAQLARLYHRQGKRVKGVNVIQKCWKLNPHPELVEVWKTLAPPPKKKKAPRVTGLRWFEKLLALKDNTPQGQMIAGQLAMEEHLWGDARRYFLRAEALGPSAALYEMLIALEKQTEQGDGAMQIWRDKLEAAPLSPTWICSDTGRIYARWQAVAPPHGAFNTIEWRRPDEGVSAPDNAAAEIEPIMSADALEARG